MGVIAISADCAVSWIIRLQKATALSKTEVEIIASSEGAKELGWLKWLLSDLLSDFTEKKRKHRYCTRASPTPVHQTNQRTRSITKGRNTLRYDTSM
jgi:hypothetical protein